MQRKVILDIVPRKKPQSQGRPKAVVEREPAVEERRSEPKTVQRPPARRDPRAHKSSGWLLRVVVIFGLLSFVVFGALTYFASAKITVERKSEEFEVKIDTLSQYSKGDLGFKTMQIVREGSATIPANAEKNIETKAEGTVIIYNDYSAAPYRLIKNSRLESSGGLIFKIAESVIIPGKKTINGVSTPGSAQVSVFADSSGPEYNVGLADFTIPGFKGYPQYSSFYARSKSEIAGGWSGKKNIPLEKDRTAALEKMKAELTEALYKQAAGEIPENHVLLQGAFSTAFSEPTEENSNAGVTIKMTATFKAALFMRSDIEKAILAKAGKKVTTPSEIEGIESLRVISKEDMRALITAEESVPLSFVGTTTIRSLVSTEALQKALAGSPRSELKSNLAAFPGIVSADAKIIPFWKRAFPNDPKEIKVTVK